MQMLFTRTFWRRWNATIDFGGNPGFFRKASFFYTVIPQAVESLQTSRYFLGVDLIKAGLKVMSCTCRLAGSRLCVPAIVAASLFMFMFWFHSRSTGGACLSSGQTLNVLLVSFPKKTRHDGTLKSRQAAPLPSGVITNMVAVKMFGATCCLDCSLAGETTHLCF